MKLLDKIWYGKQPLIWLLLPLSFLYRLVILIRRSCYQNGVFKSQKIKVPVIVVGNLSVGGTGKTPLLMALVALLQKKGFHPGVVSRGYGGKSQTWPQLVTKDSDSAMVGDEAVLIAKKVSTPVVVGPKRVVSANYLLSKFPDCDVIISDDGLQHYALKRDVEIAVIDGMRRFGNSFCLPAGPLREPVDRLKEVDFVICNGESKVNEYSMQFNADKVVNLKDPQKVITFEALADKKIIALAGIGNPARFFETLRKKNLTFDKKVFPDHYHFKASDIHYPSDTTVLMTEKDAVKCVSFARENHWVVQGEAVLDKIFMDDFLRKLKYLLNNKKG